MTTNETSASSHTDEDEKGTERTDESKDEDEDDEETIRSGRFSVDARQRPYHKGTRLGKGNASKFSAKGQGGTKGRSPTITTPTYGYYPYSKQGYSKYSKPSDYYKPTSDQDDEESGDESGTSTTTKKSLADTISKAVKSQMDKTLQTTKRSAQRSLNELLTKTLGESPFPEPTPLPETECPSFQDCYEGAREKFLEVFTYDHIQAVCEKIWDGFVIMGGGHTPRPRSCAL